MDNLVEQPIELLRVEKVSKAFGAVRALEEVSLTINAGEPTAVIGPNGAGKTTLFNMISGVFSPDGGRVVFSGIDITGLSLQEVSRAGIVRVFQNPRVFDNLSVWENVLIGCESIVPNHYKDAAHLATQLIEAAGLAKSRTFLAKSLTFADKRFLELARAIGRKPRLLLLDEPAAGLSVERQGDWVRFINTTISMTKTSLLFIEHCTAVVAALATRYVILNNGKK